MKEVAGGELTQLSIGVNPLIALAFLYLVGVGVALLTIDARGVGRLGLALLWPLGPLAFVVTISMLLAASLVAFPAIGALALAAALVAAALLLR